MSKQTICTTADLVKNSGICTLIEQGGEEKQVALFYMPETEQKIFAVGNWDPVGKANVMSRGLLGNVGDELVIISPLYKQRYSLVTGKCLEEDESLPTYPVALEGDNVVLSA